MTSSNPPIREYLRFLADQFAFDADRARRFVSLFQEEMARGLRQEPSSLKMLSSFVKRPAGREKGRYLALDLGGTNFRVMAVELAGNRSFDLISANRYSIPGELMAGEGDLLFDFIASSLDSFLARDDPARGRKYGLGFTFSFPVRQTGIKTGSLISWTKGFSATGVVGNDVVELLERALKRRNMERLTVEALANDTVGTLMAKSYQKANCDLGVILGTGTNACYPEGDDYDEVIINTEWGNFDKFEPSDFDRVLDLSSNNRGNQLFEKAVSGMYLGEIFRLIIRDMARRGLLFPFLRRLASHEISRPYSITGENLSRIAAQSFDFGTLGLEGVSSDEKLILRSIAGMVSQRSAKLAAAAVAAILLWQDEELGHEHLVAVDGSLFEKYAGYQETMRSFLKEILGARAERIQFELAKDGSGIGAAIIAAVASGR